MGNSFTRWVTSWYTPNPNIILVNKQANIQDSNQVEPLNKKDLKVINMVVFGNTKLVDCLLFALQIDQPKLTSRIFLV